MNTITYGHKVTSIQVKRKGNETLGKTARVKDEQSDKEKVPGAAASVAAIAGVATAGVRSAHSIDGERCDMELAPSTLQGVEMFTTPMQQLPVNDAHLPVSRQENKDSLKDFGECRHKNWPAL